MYHIDILSNLYGNDMRSMFGEKTIAHTHAHTRHMTLEMGQVLVRLRYRVSDVLDLSLVSKRFGFWPHITHVIVLTFKEIKHLSDYRTVGLSDRRTIGLSDYRTVGL